MFGNLLLNKDGGVKTDFGLVGSLELLLDDGGQLITDQGGWFGTEGLHKPSFGAAFQIVFDGLALLRSVLHFQLLIQVAHIGERITVHLSALMLLLFYRV